MTENIPGASLSGSDPLRMSPAGPMRVLVTGATGYIGGRLMTRLMARGHRLRCVARNPSRLEGHPWPGVEIVRGDLEDPAAAAQALQGADVAYYLIHSMAAGATFRERDRLMALAEFVTKNLAICVVCGCPANRSQRLTHTRKRISVGATDKYEARCRRCFERGQTPTS